ncbi:DNA-directed RNA polymerase subunit beta [Aeribacillus pallidus]|uniref:DNA-directed RNA polymerase subunit beta n=1 Tax=Aeribacillus pallidus TaxID=33936 RepID=UPI003D1CD8A4
MAEEVQQIVKTREEVKKEKKEGEPSSRTKKRVRVRLIPIWLRLIIVVVLTFVSLVVGAVVGYGVIGDGKPSDTFKKSTWTHIIDLVNKE